MENSALRNAHRSLDRSVKATDHLVRQVVVHTMICKLLYSVGMLVIYALVHFYLDNNLLVTLFYVYPDLISLYGLVASESMRRDAKFLGVAGPSSGSGSGSGSA